MCYFTDRCVFFLVLCAIYHAILERQTGKRVRVSAEFYRKLSALTNRQYGNEADVVPQYGF